MAKEEQQKFTSEDSATAETLTEDREIAEEKHKGGEVELAAEQRKKALDVTDARAEEDSKAVAEEKDKADALAVDADEQSAKGDAKAETESATREPKVI